MKIAIPKERITNEKRVALTPEVATHLQKLGFSIAIESDAGILANFYNDAYREAGVEIITDTSTLWKEADIILKVRAPEKREIAYLAAEKTLICFIWPAQNPALLKQLAASKATVLAMDSVPRISRAQKLDALSSMSNIAGHRAVIEAAHCFGRFFGGQITAAGKTPPAKLMVIGAGVAGLAAIGTAKSMGAIVKAFDTRSEVRQQIESMDAEYLELNFQEEGSGTGGYSKEMSEAFLNAEKQLFADQAKTLDIIITTALIPGKKAPKLLTAELVESMKDGSVIVDLASEQGGNCELTEPGKIVVKHGVTLIGYDDLPSRLPSQASQMYATNLRHLMTDMTSAKDGNIVIDTEDEVIRNMTVTHAGEITWQPPQIAISKASTTVADASSPKVIEEKKVEQPSKFKAITRYLPIALLVASLYGISLVASPSLITHFTVFILACFVGYMVIWNVTPSLHTPLMSITNAISSIIIIGALLQISANLWIVVILAAIGILITSINIAGGFAITQRMLRMFRK